MPKSGVTEGEITREEIYHEFWTQLLARARTRTNLHAAVSASRGPWIAAGAGKAHLGFDYYLRLHDAEVLLYFDHPDEETNKRRFDYLRLHKGEIEASFGGRLNWQRLEDRKACRIRHRVDLGGREDPEHWPEIQDALIDAMVRLERASSPHIERL